MFCDPSQLRGIEPDGHSTARVQLSGPGLRGGAAAGVSQVVGSPLAPGQTLTVSGAINVSSRSVLFVSGARHAPAPDLWPAPSLTVGFAAGNLAGGRASVTFRRSGVGLSATLTDGSGRVIQPGYVDSVTPPAAGPQVLFAYFVASVAIEDNPDDQNCTVKISDGKILVSPSRKSCTGLQRAAAHYAKQPAKIQGNTATIVNPASPSNVIRFRRVGGRWYMVITQ
jgi:hypothetical protein